MEEPWEVKVVSYCCNIVKEFQSKQHSFRWGEGGNVQRMVEIVVSRPSIIFIYLVGVD